MADFATKPLQGALFQRFRDLIMGVAVVHDKNKPRKGKKSLALQKVALQECVGVRVISRGDAKKVSKKNRVCMQKNN